MWKRYQHQPPIWAESWKLSKTRQIFINLTTFLVRERVEGCHDSSWMLITAEADLHHLYIRIAHPLDPLEPLQQKNI